MRILHRGRKIFEDNHKWYHVDYIERREVVEIGEWREVVKMLAWRGGDPWGSPVIKKAVIR